MNGIRLHWEKEPEDKNSYKLICKNKKIEFIPGKMVTFANKQYSELQRGIPTPDQKALGEKIIGTEKVCLVRFEPQIGKNPQAITFRKATTVLWNEVTEEIETILKEEFERQYNIEFLNSPHLLPPLL